MATIYQFVFTLKTSQGAEGFAKFLIGNSREQAYDIFHKLKGTDEVSEKNILYVDFIETREGLPLNIKMITCTLDQLGENCKIITKELFRLNNLKKT